MLLIILLVCFIVVMLLWFLSLVGGSSPYAHYSPWLAFFACAILGAVVFLVGSGQATLPK